jgi:hypothetical protein
MIDRKKRKARRIYMSSKKGISSGTQQFLKSFQE